MVADGYPVQASLNSTPPLQELTMRTPLICLAVGLVLLAGCDKKKSFPTERTGSIFELRSAPTAPAVLPATSAATRLG